VPRRRTRERGQVVPLMALMMIVITGFVGVTIDAGIDYAQSRSDHDVSDAASLAAAYALASGASLGTAYQDAENIAKIDGCTDTGACQVPDFTVGGVAYPYLQVWTSAYTSGSNPNYYVNSSGQCSTSYVTFTTTTCPSVSTVTDVGAAVQDSTTTYFSAPAGGKASKVVGNAVAQTSGSSGGSSGGNGISFKCMICVLNTYNASSVSGATMESSSAGNIEVGVETELGYDNTITASGSGNTVDLAGTVKDDGSTMVDTNTGSQSTNGCTSALNYEEDTISPCPYSTAAVTNPLAGVNLDFTSSSTYTYSGSTYSFAAGKYCTTSTCTTWTTPSATAAWALNTAGTYYLQPGYYYGITTGAGGTVTLDLAPGVYIFDGSGLQLNGSAIVLQNTPGDSGGVSLYFTCGSSGSPANCTSGTGASAAEFYTSPSSLTMDLTAPTSGFDSNLLFWYDALATCTSQTGGDCFNLAGGSWSIASTGAMYAASGTLNISNTVSLPGPLIVDNINMTGSSVELGGSTGITGTTTVSETVGPGNLAQ